ncbi:YrzI family small protein [Rossellomorea oryzaecorticis]|uniref:YrzI family small protein n=1 Tax=Rossellomorea oryzaecorticis TaxID=1396505 RepID=A0ABU9KG98_9BACI
MTLNLLFVTVTFKKKQESFEEAEHNCNVTKQYEQTKTKQHYLSNIY